MKHMTVTQEASPGGMTKLAKLTQKAVVKGVPGDCPGSLVNHELDDGREPFVREQLHSITLPEGP